MGLSNTNPLTRVGDGVDAATLNINGDKNALEVESASLQIVLTDILEELKIIRELFASQL